jgi:fructose-1,6-bisphosphatase/sedoheptulose 1,7-bisphosphatase-like protein
MKYKWFFLLCVGEVVVFALFRNDGLRQTFFLNQRAFYEKTKQLDLNMPLEKVIEIMGKPHGKLVTDGELWLFYKNRHSEAETIITPEGVKGCFVVVTNNCVSEFNVFY